MHIHPNVFMYPCMRVCLCMHAIRAIRNSSRWRAQSTSPSKACMKVQGARTQTYTHTLSDMQIHMQQLQARVAQGRTGTVIRQPSVGHARGQSVPAIPGSLYAQCQRLHQHNRLPHMQLQVGLRTLRQRLRESRHLRQLQRRHHGQSMPGWRHIQAGCKIKG